MNTTLIVVCILAGIVMLGILGLRFLRGKLGVNDVMEAYAKDAVDAARRSFQVRLDYSDASISSLEEIVGRQHDEYAKGAIPTEEQMNIFCKMWGAYLGEVMRRKHGGEWILPTEGPFAGVYTLDIAGGQISPPSRVWKRIVEGPEENLDHYFRYILRARDRGSVSEPGGENPS